MAANPNQPPVDTPVFTGSRLSEIWRMWFTSIASAANAVAGALLASNNLSDLTSDATARQNLGLGSAATHNVTDFDAAGAAAAVAATVPTKVSQLANDSAYITSAGAPVQSVAGRKGAVTLSSSDIAGLGSAALQPSSAFDSAGAWSSWTGAVNANSNNLSNVYILGTAGLQVSAFATIYGSLNYTDGAATYMTSNNAGGGAWNEFSYYLQKGASQSADQFWISTNQRTTSGGADSYIPALQIQAVTGAVTFPNQVTFSAAPVFSNAAGTRAALGLATVASSGSYADLSSKPTIPAAQVAANLGSSSSTGVSGTLPVANGGTGATTAAAALTELGAGGLSAANTWSGANTFSAAISGTLGGWQSWTPTVTASGSMTISGLTVNDAQYLRIGPLVFFKLMLTMTLGGTMSNIVYATLPLASVGQNTLFTCGVSNAGQSSYSAGFSFLPGASATLDILQSGWGNFPAGGSYCLFVEGFYRAA